jgi:hypothetical protein
MRIMAYSTRVLSKDEEFPPFEDLADIFRTDHPDFRLVVEEGDEDVWETLLLSSTDEVEVAVLERSVVFDGSFGQDEIADLLEDLHDCRPESAREWLEEVLGEVKTVYAFRHLAGAETEDGGAALHALRSAVAERGTAILQADLEGYTNEEGYHILWQFNDSVSGPWDMAVLEDNAWRTFTMDLGDPEHREAFWNGFVPADVPTGRGKRRAEWHSDLEHRD